MTLTVDEINKQSEVFLQSDSQRITQESQAVKFEQWEKEDRKRRLDEIKTPSEEYKEFYSSLSSEMTSIEEDELDLQVKMGNVVDVILRAKLSNKEDYENLEKLNKFAAKHLTQYQDKYNQHRHPAFEVQFPPCFAEFALAEEFQIEFKGKGFTGVLEKIKATLDADI